MITYDLNLCIGIEGQGKGVVVKCHDTGVNLRVWLSVMIQKTWRAETEPYIIPDGSTAVLKIAKPDKTFVLVDGEITGGYILFDLSEHPQAFTVAGVSEAEVSLFDANGHRLTTATFEIDIPKECVCDCEDESETYVDIMAKQIGAAIDAEKCATEAASRAENALDKMPIIGENGHWWLWNASGEEYVDSGVKAQGVEGPPGPKPVKGEDYLTPDDVAILVSETLAALPTYNGEVE